MNQGTFQKVFFAVRIVCAALVLGLSVFLFINRDMFTLTPWVESGGIEWAMTASGNGGRIAVVGNSQRSVLVLSPERELLYQLNAKPGNPESFSTAMYVEIDERNNLYVHDTRFGGAFEDNVERILKYSPEGEFVEEIYAYQYINEDFIITKGKISGMTYFDGAIYLVRLEHDGFYLDRVPTANPAAAAELAFFEYPGAFRDLAYCTINADKKRLALTTQAGSVKQYDFSGMLLGEWDAPGESLPWMAVSDGDDNILYTDVISGAIVFIDTASGERSVLFTAQERSEGSPYYCINYTRDIFFATSEDQVLVVDKNGAPVIIDAYAYSQPSLYLRTGLFAGGIAGVIAALILLVSFINFLSRRQFSETFKRIVLVGLCITFGTGLSSILIINEMNERYYESTYNDLENISRLLSTVIDTKVLTSINSPAQYNSEEFRRLSGALKSLFSQLQFKGKRVYQYIWMERNGVVYSMYDSESALGTFFPYEEFEGSTQQEVYTSREYVYTSDITSTGRWLFANGPVFGEDGKVAAVIETGYDMRSVEEQTRTMIIQTLLAVIAASVVFLLTMIEFILIHNAYKRNVLEWSEDKTLPFRPELLRLFIFLQFAAANLATALLPMYAAGLYQPLFNLPREFIITLPFTSNVIFVVLAMLIVPNVLKLTGLKRISIISAFFFATGCALCFAATNILFLSAGYALIGFAGGALVLVYNTIIGAQKDVKDMNSGFAHFNASYLAGINAGVVFGSIIAQFFPYRIVFLFAAVLALVLFIVFLCSVNSKYLRHMYDIIKEEPVPIDYQIDRYLEGERAKKYAMLKFTFSPLALGALFLLLLPYVVSMSFTEYFVPIYGIENGLRESNIGQLMLLSGLFAILFSTTLCEYFSRKFSLKATIAMSLLLNAGGIYLFSLNISMGMLIAAVTVLAVANIFVLTTVQTYYATLYQDAHVSSMKALSLYSMVENISMAIGPVVFSYILSNNIAEGMKIFAYASLACLGLFLLLALFFSKRKKALQEA
jgi:predicted MFS family arabinose efflux permease